ncbi:hypothetical protein [Mucilaginibacter sp.]
MLKEITVFIGQQGAVAGIQPAYAWRKASHARPRKGGKLIPASLSLLLL